MYVRFAYEDKFFVMTSPLLDRITIQPGLMEIKPTIRGLCFPVTDILELLSSGQSDWEMWIDTNIHEDRFIAYDAETGIVHISPLGIELVETTIIPK